jgi:hypothetical protein
LTPRGIGRWVGMTHRTVTIEPTMPPETPGVVRRLITSPLGSVVAAAVLGALGAGLGLLLGGSLRESVEGCGVVAFAAAVVLGPIHAEVGRRDDDRDPTATPRAARRRGW